MEIKITSLKFKYPVLPFVIIFFIGIPLAMFVRLQIIEKTNNIGFGNLIFVTIFIIWFFVYFAMVDITYHLHDSFKNKIKFFQQDKSAIKIKDTLRDYSKISSVENIVKEDKLPILNEVETEITHLKISEKMVEDVMKKQKSSNLLKEKKKLDCFLVYTKITMESYTKSEELEKLEAYIRTYSENKQIESFDFLIETEGLENDDLINFGYNMVNHFDYTTLKKFVLPLIGMFKNLNGLEEDYIRGKLYYKESNKKNKIICIKNISQYLDELLQDK